MLETTNAGSLPKPEWLAEPEKLWAVWRFEGEELKRAQERAVVEWLRHQEEAGIDIVTDGEQFRIHFVHGFLEHIEGIDWEKKTVMGIGDNRYSVHICYGYGIAENLRWKETLGNEWRQYEEIFPALNTSRIDQISLECAESRVPLSLMGLLKDKDVMVGAVAVTPDRV